MSEYSSDYDPELEELKRRELARAQQRVSSQDIQERNAAAEAEEARRQAILRQALTREARQRLQTVKMVKPNVARMLEDQIIAVYQSGKLDRPITDSALKQLLYRISSTSSRETSITIRRKGEV
jgi:programmed cell death protein 5